MVKQIKKWKIREPHIKWLYSICNTKYDWIGDNIWSVFIIKSKISLQRQIYVCYNEPLDMNNDLMTCHDEARCEVCKTLYLFTGGREN